MKRLLSKGSGAALLSLGICSLVATHPAGADGGQCYLNPPSQLTLEGINPVNMAAVLHVPGGSDRIALANHGGKIGVFDVEPDGSVSGYCVIGDQDAGPCDYEDSEYPDFDIEYTNRSVDGLALDFDNPESIIAGGFSGVWLLKANSSGSFDPPEKVITTGGTYNPGNPLSAFVVTTAVAGQDVNGDTLPDLVSGYTRHISATGERFLGVAVLLNNGAGQLESIPIVSAIPVPALDSYHLTALSVADFTFDGRVDVVISNGFQNFLMVGLGNGAFAIGHQIPVPEGFNIMAAAPGNLRGSGKFDLVLALRNWVGGTSMLQVHETPVGDLSNPTIIPLPLPPGASKARITDLAIADVNRDSKNDIVVGEIDHGVYIVNRSTEGEYTSEFVALGKVDELEVGRFSGPAFDLMLRAHFYEPGNRIIQNSCEDIVPSPCPGDLTGDLAVGQADLGILLSDFNTGPAGDLDGDSDTDVSDLGILLANYGHQCLMAPPGGQELISSPTIEVPKSSSIGKESEKSKASSKKNKGKKKKSGKKNRKSRAKR